ncbi:helix-turn-helix domain-containing protein [Lysobacter niastensis]|uniref:DNA-binding protein n=1 Tax=Lysobacter niastensis TaxID=380629 RepID=A0ABS0BBT8_9GAMM|nr:helix-turn-helix domain-containing protein [Lysobacter niastensis]MBF6025387.1 DNA-binding protein [Lysobacter niastensis]
MPTTHAAFARRLNQALDHVGFTKGRGRTTALACQHDVSRETSRKWLGGLALPELERIIALATQTGVAIEWLITGRGAMVLDGLSVREAAPFPYASADQRKLIDLFARLSPKRRRALLELLGSA